MVMPNAHVGIGAYVLDALPADERRGFEEHLAGCSICQAELPGLTEAASRLGSAVAEQPPPSLKPRVMVAVGSTAQLPPIARHSRPGPVTEYPQQPPATPPGPDGRQPPQNNSHGPQGAQPPTGPDEPEAYYDAEPPEQTYTRRNLLGLAASVLAVAGAGAVGYDQYTDARNLRRERDRVAAVLNESDARTTRGAIKGGGRATIVRSRRRDEAVLVVAGLPAAATGREYQLWFIQGETPARSLGLLGRTPEPSDTRVIAGGIARATAFGLSIEPTGGSPQPTQVVQVLPFPTT